jgi:hypothetical protein
MKRGWEIVSFAVMAVAIMVTIAYGMMVEAAPDPLVKDGQTYIVVWSCLPKAGCYAEVMRIEQVRLDGWADVVSCAQTTEGEALCRDDRWRTNLSNALSIQRYTGKGRRNAD